ncbi:MAG: hypothetical protein ACKVZH_13415 [Blastocatellia bacterium]
MNKAKKPQPVVSAAQAITSGDWTLKFDPQANLNVTVASPNKQPESLHRNLRWFILAFAALFVTWVIFNAKYVWRICETSTPINQRDAKLDVTITYPMYATFGEETDLLMNITNRSDEKFTGEVTLLFEGAMSAFPVPGESATAKLEKLPPGSRHSHRVKFAVRHDPSWYNSGGVIPMRLKVITDECNFQSPVGGPAIALPQFDLPLRAFNNFLSSPVGLAMIGAIALLIWEVIRKFVFKMGAQ